MRQGNSHDPLVISHGASFGTILRWRLGVAFNALFPTLLASMLGGT